MTDDLTIKVEDEVADIPDIPLDVEQKPPLCDVHTAPTAEEIEDSRIEPSTDPSANPYGDVRRRMLLVFVQLPEYLKDKEHPEKGIDLFLQEQMYPQDIRNAMAAAARKLDQHARKYSVRGYTWDLDTIEYDIPKPRLLSAAMAVTRD